MDNDDNVIYHTAEDQKSPTSASPTSASPAGATPAPPPSPTVGPAPSPRTPSPLSLPAAAPQEHEWLASEPLAPEPPAPEPSAPAAAPHGQAWPSPEQLAALLIPRAPQVYRFYDGQAREDRAALMAKVPPEAQAAAKIAMFKTMLHDFKPEARSQHDLLRLMTAREKSEANSLIDLSADDPDAPTTPISWRLAYYEYRDMCLCDFVGWPSDTQFGAGVFWWRGHSAEMTPIYVVHNTDIIVSDRCMDSQPQAAKWPIRRVYWQTLKAFGSIRMTDPDDESDDETGDESGDD